MVKKSWEISNGVLIPPRRKNLFLNIEKSDICKYKKDPKLFNDFIYSSAFTEVERLKKVYGEARAKVVHAMKYSFADIGNIIKGDDMMDKDTSDKIGKILGDTDGQNEKRIIWWSQNKYHIWESMLCAYQKDNKKIEFTSHDCKMPDTEKTPQFLRWLIEWSKQVCAHKLSKAKYVKENCSNYIKDKESDKEQCINASNIYIQWMNKQKEPWKILSNIYTNYKNEKNMNYPNLPRNASYYVREKCPECICNLEHLEEKENQNHQNGDHLIEEAINKAKMDLPDTEWGISWGPWKVNWENMFFISSFFPRIKIVSRDTAITNDISNVSHSKDPVAKDRSINDAMVDVVNIVTQPVTTVIDNVTPTLGRELNKVVNPINNILNEVTTSVQSSVTKVKETGNKITEDIKKIIDNMGNIMEGIIQSLEKTKEKEHKEFKSKQILDSKENTYPNTIVPTNMEDVLTMYHKIDIIAPAISVGIITLGYALYKVK